MSSRDNLGDRIKLYERIETRDKLIPNLPVIIRLDGRSFHTYAKKFDRPFDEDMTESMVATTKYLVDQSNALLGYTQSDEITLILYTDNPGSSIMFDGKKHKLLSNLASLASVKFYTEITKRKVPENLPRSLPSFDCRLFQVPNKMEAWNSLLWRIQDAVRNSIQMLAQANFSHKQLHGKTQRDCLDMLMEKGINWNELPHYNKEGVVVRRETITRHLTPEELDKIPVDKRPTDMDESCLVQRSQLSILEFDDKLNAISNRVEFIFDKADPIYMSDFSEVDEPSNGEGLSSEDLKVKEEYTKLKRVK